jgi:hypothetical protein
MNRLLMSSFFLILGQICYTQTIYPTSDSIHIFWQPEVKLSFADYKGPLTKEVEELMVTYDFTASASVGIWSILDIPEKKKDRGKKFEKAYFAPAFERTTSYTKSDDSLQISMQNIYFDICELATRGARRELDSFQDSMNAIGAVSIMYSTVKQGMENFKLEMYRGYFKDVFIDKKDGAFVWWRKLVDKWLEDSKDYTTTKEECYRLLSGKPIEAGYIQAPTIIGPLTEDRN